ncbi:MAG: hypothetical protein M3O88_05355 [Actinomycetota bacterium]|nr:hypothetical protein [Actinomycetota bacterium]
MEPRRILSRTIAALAALTLAIAPARSVHVARSGSVHVDAIAISPETQAPQVLVSAGTAAPDAEIRPTDERDPLPPLPGSAVIGVLLAAAALCGFLQRAPGGRIRSLRWGSSTPLAHRPPS